jgi:hypothetical protein
VNVTVQAASIDTDERDRDAHLRSADFFDVEKFPPLTFRSGAITRVTFDANFLGKARDPWGNERIAFETGGFLVGDEVKISLSVQAVPTRA